MRDSGDGSYDALLKANSGPGRWAVAESRPIARSLRVAGTRHKPRLPILREFFTEHPCNLHSAGQAHSLVRPCLTQPNRIDNMMLSNTCGQNRTLARAIE